jgi:Clp amino terminal domain, pathogenicity island component
VFDRCDEHTTVIVKTAVAEAGRLGHNHVGTEHLLVALSRHRNLLPAPVADLLPPADDLLARVVGEAGAAAGRDAELLRVVGIELDQVRAAVRRTFGDDAVDQLGRRRVHQPWQPWRRPSRRCTSLLAGSLTMAPRVKQAFELARRHADDADGVIRPAGLLLGMIDVEDAISNRLLIESGVDPATLRRRLAG